jgi:hypothetical protein
MAPFQMLTSSATVGSLHAAFKKSYSLLLGRQAECKEFGVLFHNPGHVKAEHHRYLLRRRPCDATQNRQPG